MLLPTREVVAHTMAAVSSMEVSLVGPVGVHTMADAAVSSMEVSLLGPVGVHTMDDAVVPSMEVLLVELVGTYHCCGVASFVGVTDAESTQ